MSPSAVRARLLIFASVSSTLKSGVAEVVRLQENRTLTSSATPKLSVDEGLCLKSRFDSEPGVASADWAAAYYSQVQPHRTFEAKP